MSSTEEEAMERGSDKHNPRVDEAMKDDVRSLVQGAPVESRAEEEREQEGPGDGEPGPDVLLAGGGNDAVHGLTHAEVEARADLARHLPGAVFPCRRGVLVAAARDTNAPSDVIARLESLPDNTYDNVEAVWEAIGGRRETRA